jgi:flagellar assembly protein FliH
LGRIVKGVRIAQQTYQVKPPPSAPAPRHSPAISFDEAIFGERPEDAEVCTPEPHDYAAAAREEAAQLIDDAARDAAQLIRDAEERAHTLVAEAERRSAEIEAQAKQQGFEQGGSDGRAAVQAEMDEMLETMRGLVEMARVERHKIIESAEPEIVKLSVAISERILNQHIALDHEAVVELARSAISRLVNRETVTVRVHPADVEVMRQHRDTLMQMNDIDNLRIIEDQRVDRGGVVIETDAGNIDAKISTQLREVRRLLAVEEPISVGESNEPAIINAPAQAS